MVFHKPSRGLKGFNRTHQDDDAVACWELQKEEWIPSVNVPSLSIAFLSEARTVPGYQIAFSDDYQAQCQLWASHYC